MFSTILAGIIGALAGAWFRYEARDARRPWLVTAALGAVALVVFGLMPPGQEFFAVWGFLFITAAVGAVICGITCRFRK